MNKQELLNIASESLNITGVYLKKCNCFIAEKFSPTESKLTITQERFQGINSYVVNKEEQEGSVRYNYFFLYKVGVRLVKKIFLKKALILY